VQKIVSLPILAGFFKYLALEECFLYNSNRFAGRLLTKKHIIVEWEEYYE